MHSKNINYCLDNFIEWKEIEMTIINMASVGTYEAVPGEFNIEHVIKIFSPKWNKENKSLWST